MASVTELEHRIRSLAPVLFLFFAVPAVIFLAFNMPLFQNPDEPRHFLRAVQVAGGEILGTRQGAVSGGSIDPQALTLISKFTHIPFDAKARFTLDKLREARAVSWSTERAFAEFRNTVVYPPFLYTPVILGVAMGKAMQLSPYHSALLARLLNGFAAVALGFLALSVCRRGRLLMFTVLLLPMSLSLYASCSQDALIITTSCLAVALVSRIVAENRPAERWETLAIGLLAALACMARPPYLPLAGLLLIPYALTARPHGPIAERATAVLAIAGVLALTGAWIAVAAGLQVTIARPGVTPSPGEQLGFLLAHPAAIGAIAVNTFHTYGSFYTGSFVGILGWLDTPFPEHYYRWAFVVLGLAVLGDAAGRAAWSGRAMILGAAILVLSALFIFGVQYLTWTNVGDGIVEGVQGRYFLALAPLFAFLFPRLPLPSWMRAGLSAAVVGFPLVTLVYLPRVIIERYYLM